MSLYCDACQVNCNSQQNYDTHCSGRKHMMKVQQQAQFMGGRNVHNRLGSPGMFGGPMRHGKPMTPQQRQGKFKRPYQRMAGGPGGMPSMMMSGGMYPLGGGGLSFDNPIWGSSGMGMGGPGMGNNSAAGYYGYYGPNPGMGMGMMGGQWPAYMNSGMSDEDAVDDDDGTSTADQLLAGMLPTDANLDGNAYYGNAFATAVMVGGLTKTQQEAAKMEPIPDPLPQAILNEQWTKRSSAVYCEVCEKVCHGLSIYFIHCQCKTHIKKVEFLRGTGRKVPDCSRPMVTRRVAASAGVKLPPNPPKKDRPEVEGEVKPTPADFVRLSLEQMMNRVRAPVGMDYIEEVTDDSGNVTFHCKLCEKKFTDVKGRDVHLCGKKHRAAYRKNVDPTLDVPQKKPKGPAPQPSSGIAAKRRERKQRKLESMDTDQTTGTIVNPPDVHIAQKKAQARAQTRQSARQSQRTNGALQGYGADAVNLYHAQQDQYRQKLEGYYPGYM